MLSFFVQEPLPEPTATELAKEAEAEALVWSQGGAIDTLLQKLREFDPATDNLNDSEEIQVGCRLVDKNYIRIIANSLGIVPFGHVSAPQDSQVN
jgi:hypothetical protein